MALNNNRLSVKVSRSSDLSHYHTKKPLAMMMYLLVINTENRPKQNREINQTSYISIARGRAGKLKL